eukprot:COSAG02_NODE_3366_length_6865_cov_21.795300_5_plen_242_part_01
MMLAGQLPRSSTSWPEDRPEEPTVRNNPFAPRGNPHLDHAGEELFLLSPSSLAIDIPVSWSSPREFDAIDAIDDFASLRETAAHAVRAAGECFAADDVVRLPGTLCRGEGVDFQQKDVRSPRPQRDPPTFDFEGTIDDPAAKVPTLAPPTMHNVWPVLDMSSSADADSETDYAITSSERAGEKTSPRSRNLSRSLVAIASITRHSSNSEQDAPKVFQLAVHMAVPPGGRKISDGTVVVDEV